MSKRQVQYSVLMTVFDRDEPDFFLQSLSSMINQTLRPHEIVIVKDGFINDRLQSVIDNCYANYPNINQIQLPINKGLGHALQIGLVACKCELVARMDADDISCANRCELQAVEFEKNQDLDIVGCQVLEFADDTNNIVGRRNVPINNEEIYAFAKLRDPFNHPTVMFKRSKVIECGNYSDYRKNQDTDLWIKMLANNCICKNLELPLLYFRFDENTYKKRKNWLNTKSLLRIRYNAYKIGFCGIDDFIKVAVMQMVVYLLPIKFQQFIYKKFLRR